MGVGVSSWQLARAVSLRGQLGVVSGTAIDTVMVRRLQDGDTGGHVRRAAGHFPNPDVANSTLRRYFHANGRQPGTPYRLLPMYKQTVSVAREQLTILAAFVEVWLAKEGHDSAIGLNLLTKVQMPNLATLYGAMLAGVDVVLMGAGIPREIPGVLDAFAQHRTATLRLDVADDAKGVQEFLTFDPKLHFPDVAQPMRRPAFYAIVSASSLATTLGRKSTGKVDGFIVEGFTAGGHNAPPRGAMTLDARGEPVYGERDVVDLEKMRELGIPFWLAGGQASPTALRTALAAGATGIQAGTIFAYCNESGLGSEIKRAVLAGVRAGRVSVATNPLASPTGYPFKVVTVDTLQTQSDNRLRLCDVGYLRSAYRTRTGHIGYRCAAEPVATYVAKGGDMADTVGRHCLCNGLLAAIAQAQPRGKESERPLVTSGDHLISLDSFLAGRDDYSADDVIDYLLSDMTPAAPL